MSMIGFRKELLEQRTKELETLVRNIAGISADRAADILISSVTHMKTGDQIEDSPVYKVAVVMNAMRKDNNFLGISTRKALIKGLEAATGLKYQQVRNMLHYYDWRLPNHLKPVRRLGRALQDIPKPPEPPPVDTQEVKLEDKVSEIKIKGAGIEITIKMLKE